MRGDIVPLFLWFLGHAVHKSAGRSIFLSKIHEENHTDIVKMINQQIIDQLKRGSAPCDDFYSYTCGDHIVNSARHKKENKLFDVLASLANGSKPIPDSGPKWKRLIVTFMKRCTAHQSPLRNDGTRDFENLDNFLAAFEGWKVFNWHRRIRGHDSYELLQPVESILGQIWREMGVGSIFREVNVDAENKEITLVAATKDLEAKVKQEIKANEAFQMMELDFKSLSSPSHGYYPGEDERFVKLMKAGRQIEEILNSTCPYENEHTPETIYVADVIQFNLAGFLNAALTNEEFEILDFDENVHGIKIKLIGITKDTLEKIGEFIQRTKDGAVSDWLKMQALVDLYHEDGQSFYLDHVKNCFDQLFSSLNLAATRFVIDEIMDDRGQLDLIIMTTYMKEAFREYFSNMPNISDLTRIDLLNKLANLRMDLGWPSWITKDAALNGWYDGLELTDDMSLGQMRGQLDRFEELKKSEAMLQPHIHYTVNPTFRDSYVENAHYVSQSNSLYIYPGIMVPPKYSQFYPAAVNFGGLGTTIGHEIGHAFDIEGLSWDYNGTSVSGDPYPYGDRGIVAPEDRHIFENESNCLIDHYNHHCLDNGTVCTDGAKTAVHNEADILGNKMAFRGFQLWLETQGSRYDQLDGKNDEYSDEQLFFLSYGRSWCEEETLEKARTAIKNAKWFSHALSPFRVRETLSQSPIFQQVFECQTGQSMAPKKRCGFWYHEEKPETVNRSF